MATATYPLNIPANGDATNPPGIEYENSIPIMTFQDGTADETCYWRFQLPADYASAPTLEIIYSCASATSGNASFSAEVWANADGEATETASYDTVNVLAATAVPGTAKLQDTVSLALTNNDSMAVSEMVSFKLYRDFDHANDTVAGDLRVHTVNFTYTTT